MTNEHATLNEIYKVTFKNDYIQDICNAVEMSVRSHETELIDVPEQHSIDKVLFGDSIDVCR